MPWESQQLVRPEWPLFYSALLLASLKSVQIYLHYNTAQAFVSTCSTKLRSSVKDMGGIMDSTVKNLERNKNIQVRIPNNEVRYQKTPKMEKNSNIYNRDYRPAAEESIFNGTKTDKEICNMRSAVKKAASHPAALVTVMLLDQWPIYPHLHCTASSTVMSAIQSRSSLEDYDQRLGMYSRIFLRYDNIRVSVKKKLTKQDMLLHWSYNS